MTRGQGFRPRLSPDENPFDGGSLAMVGRKANSRFFTDCYHQAAAIAPPHADGSRRRGAMALHWQGEAIRGTIIAVLPRIGELFFVFKCVDRAVRAPGSPGDSRRNCL